VVTPIASLIDGTGGAAAHADLGSGVVYGSRTMTAADNGSVVEIALNPSAVAALNSSNGLFGIGGSITTLDALMNNEHTFAYTEADTNVAQLRLTLVPEPSTLALLGIGGIGVLGYRQRKS
jgi:PEP-CTERM motif